jgi:hypothetical protein
MVSRTAYIQVLHDVLFKCLTSNPAPRVDIMDDVEEIMTRVKQKSA